MEKESLRCAERRFAPLAPHWAPPPPPPLMRIVNTVRFAGACDLYALTHTHTQEASVAHSHGRRPSLISQARRPILIICRAN